MQTAFNPLEMHQISPLGRRLDRCGREIFNVGPL